MSEDVDLIGGMSQPVARHPKSVRHLIARPAPVTAEGNERRLAWFTDDELVAELRRRTPAAEGTDELLDDLVRIVLDSSWDPNLDPVTEAQAAQLRRLLAGPLAPLLAKASANQRDAEVHRAEKAEERGEGICRTCLAPIWNEGGTVHHTKRAEGWSDRIERGGDSLVCFKAIGYRHVPLVGREAAIYDHAAALAQPAPGGESRG